LYSGFFRFHDRYKNLITILSFGEFKKKISFEGTTVNTHI
jgi:hypothetical protein